jgi:hypothetical protein
MKQMPGWLQGQALGQLRPAGGGGGGNIWEQDRENCMPGKKTQRKKNQPPTAPPVDITNFETRAYDTTLYSILCTVLVQPPRMG